MGYSRKHPCSLTQNGQWPTCWAECPEVMFNTVGKAAGGLCCRLCGKWCERFNYMLQHWNDTHCRQIEWVRTDDGSTPWTWSSRGSNSPIPAATWAAAPSAPGQPCAASPVHLHRGYFGNQRPAGVPPPPPAKAPPALAPVNIQLVGSQQHSAWPMSAAVVPRFPAQLVDIFHRAMCNSEL